MFQAEAYQTGPEKVMSQVVLANGMQFTARGPSPWVAGFRLVQALETYVGARADQSRDGAPETGLAAGSWKLSS